MDTEVSCKLVFVPFGPPMPLTAIYGVHLHLGQDDANLGPSAPTDLSR